MSTLLTHALLVIALAGCAGTQRPNLTDRGFDVYLQGHPAPAHLDTVIRVVGECEPPGGQPLQGGTIRIEDLPFDCDGAGLVWGCSTNDLVHVAVRIGYTPSAIDGALVEELGHVMWLPICGRCEVWADPTVPQGRDPRFKAWIDSTRAKAAAAVASGQ